VRVAVRLFARYREATGRQRLDVELPESGTVETAWAAVTTSYPELARYRPFTLFAIGQEYVEPDHVLRPGDELCLFPPVSGGSPAWSELRRAYDATRVQAPRGAAQRRPGGPVPMAENEAEPPPEQTAPGRGIANVPSPAMAVRC
jgi:molybdopterin synthase sulfur carrier subunit